MSDGAPTEARSAGALSELVSPSIWQDEASLRRMLHVTEQRQRVFYEAQSLLRNVPSGATIKLLVDTDVVQNYAHNSVPKERQYAHVNHIFDRATSEYGFAEGAFEETVSYACWLLRIPAPRIVDTPNPRDEILRLFNISSQKMAYEPYVKRFKRNLSLRANSAERLLSVIASDRFFGISKGFDEALVKEIEVVVRRHRDDSKVRVPRNAGVTAWEATWKDSDRDRLDAINIATIIKRYQENRQPASDRVHLLLVTETEAVIRASMEFLSLTDYCWIAVRPRQLLVPHLLSFQSKRDKAALVCRAIVKGLNKLEHSIEQQLEYPDVRFKELNRVSATQIPVALDELRDAAKSLLTSSWVALEYEMCRVNGAEVECGEKNGEKGVEDSDADDDVMFRYLKVLDELSHMLTSKSGVKYASYELPLPGYPFRAFTVISDLAGHNREDHIRVEAWPISSEDKSRRWNWRLCWWTLSPSRHLFRALDDIVAFREATRESTCAARDFECPVEPDSPLHRNGVVFVRENKSVGMSLAAVHRSGGWSRIDISNVFRLADSQSGTSSEYVSDDLMEVRIGCSIGQLLFVVRTRGEAMRSVVFQTDSLNSGLIARLVAWLGIRMTFEDSLSDALATIESTVVSGRGVDSTNAFES